MFRRCRRKLRRALLWTFVNCRNWKRLRWLKFSREMSWVLGVEHAGIYFWLIALLSRLHSFNVWKGIAVKRTQTGKGCWNSASLKWVQFAVFRSAAKFAQLILVLALFRHHARIRRKNEIVFNNIGQIITRSPCWRNSMLKHLTLHASTNGKVLVTWLAQKSVFDYISW